MNDPNKKPKQIAWFKGTKRRHGGRQILIVYYALREDGTIRGVDIERGKTSTIMTMISNPMTLEVCTQEEFDRAFNEVIQK